jgi:ERCC4 domain-containing protein
VATWIVERTRDRRFPFRITIEQEGRTLLAVRAQSHCPGAGKQIFCLRETELDPAEHLEPFERVRVAHLARLGRKLPVTLDQGPPRHLRADLLPDGAGRPVSSHARPRRAPPAPRARRRDRSGELYPWRFPGARVTRRKLPVGDYALVEEERLVAVVERKTRQNFLGSVHEIKGLHQQLVELGTYPHAAMVVEAQYADFGDPAKIGRWPASHLLRVIGEIAALHPHVPLVFAGNRKLANVWTERFFAGVAAARHQDLPAFVREPVARFDAEPADGGTDTRVRSPLSASCPTRSSSPCCAGSSPR